MDLVPSPSIAEQPAIIGGKPMDKTLGEFQEEMNMINKAFAEVMMEGDAKGRVFSFLYLPIILQRILTGITLSMIPSGK